MTTNVNTASAPMGAITALRVVNFVSTAVAAFMNWNERRRTVEALRRLTPSQLDDIGLTPADVEDFAAVRY